MAAKPLGIAVIGAGMAGRAHAAGYRAASQLYDLDLPELRLVAIADAHEPFATDAARRYGYGRAETGWQAISDADDIDVVSVVVANELHRPVVEALLAAGKHVLCEKPMAGTVEDAKAMVAAAEAAEAAGTIAGIGFTFRRSPAINAIREQIAGGAIGAVRHFDGHYWCDYAQDATAPISWRYLGGAGTGALADIGSHVVDLGEYLCGPVTSVSGAVYQTFITERPVPLGVAVGHRAVSVAEETRPVENEDIATFSASFANGAIGTFSVSRAAHGMPNELGFEIFAESGAAGFDLNHPGEFTFSDSGPDRKTNGWRTVPIGPQHPQVTRGMPMDFPSVGYGQNDLFAWQCRAFLGQVAGAAAEGPGQFNAAAEGPGQFSTVTLPPVPPLAHGLHNLEVLAAITESARGGGQTIRIS